MTRKIIARDVAARIADARDLAGMTTSQLARAAEVTDGMAYKFVGGTTAPSAESAVRIASALGVTVDWLLTGEGPRYRRPERDAAPSTSEEVAAP